MSGTIYCDGKERPFDEAMSIMTDAWIERQEYCLETVVGMHRELKRLHHRPINWSALAGIVVGFGLLFWIGFASGMAHQIASPIHTLKGERDRAELYLKDVQLGSGGWTNQCVAHFFGENGGEYYVQHSPFGGGLKVTYYDQDKDGYLRIHPSLHLSGAGLNPLFEPPSPLPLPSPPPSPLPPVVWILTIGDGAPNGDGTGVWCVYDETGLEVCSAASKHSARHRALLVAKERKLTIRFAELHGDVVWQYFDKSQAKVCPDCGEVIGEVIRSDGPGYGLEDLDIDDVIRDADKQKSKE